MSKENIEEYKFNNKDYMVLENEADRNDYFFNKEKDDIELIKGVIDRSVKQLDENKTRKTLLEKCNEADAITKLNICRYLLKDRQK